MRCDELRYGLRNNSVMDPTIGYFFRRRSSFSASRRMTNRSLGLFPERPDLPCLRIPMPELPFRPVSRGVIATLDSHRTAALAVLAAGQERPSVGRAEPGRASPACGDSP